MRVNYFVSQNLSATRIQESDLFVSLINSSLINLIIPLLQAGTRGEEDTLDYLWQIVVDRNERKVLDNIRRVSGIL